MQATALNIFDCRGGLEECIDRGVPVSHEAYLQNGKHYSIAR